VLAREQQIGAGHERRLARSANATAEMGSEARMSRKGPYRLVAADLDGTLLGPDGELTSATLAAVRALRNAGAALVLATSRRLTGTIPVAEALDHEGPLILYDGAQTRDYPSGTVLATHGLDRQVAQQAVEVLAGFGLRPIVQHGDEAGERLVVGPAAGDSYEVYLARFGYQVMEVPVERLCADGPDPLRVVVFGSRTQLEGAARSIADLPCGWQLLGAGNYGAAELTVFALGASKGTALEALARRLGVPMTETLAIGDGINDVSLLQAAGFGVAMANGAEVVHRVARALAPSHADDGAAWAIRRYVLGGA
jgi:hydroxymethylpyrimidine pyrophosphatase-like HAD family hydrolase